MLSGQKLQKNYGAGNPFLNDPNTAALPDAAAGPSGAKNAPAPTACDAAGALGNLNDFERPSQSFSSEMHIKSAPNFLFSVGSPESSLSHEVEKNERLSWKKNKKEI